MSTFDLVISCVILFGLITFGVYLLVSEKEEDKKKIGNIFGQGLYWTWVAMCCIMIAVNCTEYMNSKKSSNDKTEQVPTYSFPEHFEKRTITTSEGNVKTVYVPVWDDNE